MKGLPKKKFAFEVSAGAIVFQEENGERRYLLLRYPHGHWEFARGHREERETLKETARREVQEETGLTHLEILPRFRKCFYFWYSAKGREKEERIQAGRGIHIVKKVVFFLGKVPKKEMTLSHEHKGYSWLSYEESMQRLTYKNARKVLSFAEKFLQERSL